MVLPGGSCSSAYWDLGINRKNRVWGSPHARWKPDERTFGWKTILLNTGGSCSGGNWETYEKYYIGVFAMFSKNGNSGKMNWENR